MSNIILLASYLFIGALSVALAVPLVQGRVGPNPWYGFRVPKTLRDSATWYAVNAYFGRRFAVVGVLIAAAGVLLAPLALIPHIGSTAYLIAGHTGLLGSLLWVVVDTFLYLRKF